jgi:type IX secretion system PorP/SprF family membrane protein
MNIPENFDRWMFDYKEGNLSGVEKESFENFLIQNPEFEIDADAWNNSFIENEEFVYPGADALEKDRKVPAGWYGWSAAAIALILIGTSIFYFNNNSSNLIEGAEQVDTHLNDVNAPLMIQSTDELAKAQTNLEDILNEVHALNNGEVATEVVNELFGLSAGNASIEQNGYVQNGSNQSGLNGVTDPGNVSQMNLGSNNHATNGTSLGSNNSSINSDPTVSKNSLNQEYGKYNSETHKTKYAGNPEGKDLGFDVSKKEKFNTKGWQKKVKSIYRKIERMFDYPVGITNLRDPELMLPNTSILAFNPGFTGGMLSPRFEMNYRNQWFGNEQNSQQMSISFDNYIYQMRGGIGVVVNAKDMGLGGFNDYNVSLTYSPKILLSKDIVFEPAVKMTLGALNVNGDKMAPDSDFELDRGRILNTPAAQQMGAKHQLWYKDYGLGFVLNTKWFYAGFSADNLNRHFENVYNAEGYATPTSSPILMSGIVGFDYEAKRRPKDKPMSISPFVAYQQFGDRKDLWAGFNYRFNWMTLGGSISHNKDFTASVGMKFEKFKLVYHYDHTTSTLSNTQIGSHNIGIRINGSTKKTRLK